MTIQEEAVSQLEKERMENQLKLMLTLLRRKQEAEETIKSHEASIAKLDGYMARINNGEVLDEYNL